MTLSDFVRDVKNAIAPKPQVPAYRPPAYVMPVPVRVAPAQVVAQPTPSGDHGSLVSTSSHTKSRERSSLVDGK